MFNGQFVIPLNSVMSKSNQFIVTIFLLTLTLSSCQIEIPAPDESIKEGMVKIAIMYPYADDKSFDMEYYANKHMPMVAELFGDGLKHMAIDKGVSGRTEGDPLPYVAIGYFYFNQLSEYQEAFGPNAEQILNDIPNYTDIQPVIQISEVVQ